MPFFWLVVTNDTLSALRMRWYADAKRGDTGAATIIDYPIPGIDGIGFCVATLRSISSRDVGSIVGPFAT
jgi:hypothetical protein